MVGSGLVLMGLGAGLVLTSAMIYITRMLEGENDVVSDSTTLVFANKY